jgi:hypothetical protein
MNYNVSSAILLSVLSSSTSIYILCIFYEKNVITLKSLNSAAISDKRCPEKLPYFRSNIQQAIP